MTDKHDGHGPSVQEMVLEDILSGVPIENGVADGPLSHAHVIEGKDGKIDTQATIEHLIGSTKEVVAKSIPEAKADYRWIPSYDLIANAFKSIKDGVKDGHYLTSLKNALTGLYERTAQENLIAKALARIQATPLSAAKKAGVAIAKLNHDYHLVDLINEANSTGEVASYARGSIEALYAKAKQAFTYKGSVAPVKQEYAAALGGGHGHGK